ncbi:unnamed protein product [Brassica oleracea]
MGLITMLASLPAFSLNVIEAADCWLRSLPVTTTGLRHGNVEVCGSDSIIPSATSLDSILPSVSLRQSQPFCLVLCQIHQWFRRRKLFQQPPHLAYRLCCSPDQLRYT